MEYLISSALYLEVAARLQDAIAGENYYAGTLKFRFGELDCHLRVSVIVYRTQVIAPEGISFPITDLVPVWWEFHTFGTEGEQLNDFDFNELKRYIL